MPARRGTSHLPEWSRSILLTPYMYTTWGLFSGAVCPRHSIWTFHAEYHGPPLWRQRYPRTHCARFSLRYSSYRAVLRAASPLLVAATDGGGSSVVGKSFGRSAQSPDRRYKTAIPQYNHGEIQLLLPLCLDDPKVADLALVVGKEGAAYKGCTVLSLDMLYEPLDRRLKRRGGRCRNMNIRSFTA